MTPFLRFGSLLLLLPLASCAESAPSEKVFPITKSEAEWRAVLSPEAFRVLRQHGTERPYSGALLNQKEKGVYTCAGCGHGLFATADKFDSGTGWPSYTRPIAPDRIGETVDRSLGMVRTEVHCSQCGGHLGHVFPDGPKPTGLRYCINSVSLGFVADKAE